CRPPFFGAFHALAIDDGSSRARFAFGLLAARDIERMVDAIGSAVATPQYKIVMYRALRRKVLGQGAPLTTRAQDVHDPVHHLPDINRSFVAARLGGRDQRVHSASPSSTPASHHPLLLCFRRNVILVVPFAGRGDQLTLA